MNKSDQAVQTFSKGFNCSQSVFSTFCEDMGLNKAVALKISCGFGSGMRQGEVCGAVTGAIMALGLKYGHNTEGDRQSKEKTYGAVEEFNRRFKDKCGSIVCRELLGCDLGTESGREHAMDTGLFYSVCPMLIRNAVQILEEII